MANDPTDTTKYPLGTNDLYVAARNASDFDKGLNAGNTTFVNRFGKVLPTFEKAISDAKANYGGLNNRGDWVTLRAYAVNDLWQSTVDNTWYLVLTAYTSGVDEAADIASGNVEVFQGIAKQDAVIKIASVFDVDAFARLEEGDAVELISYHDGWAVMAPFIGPSGGGVGVVTSAIHNGGTAISLTKTRPVWSDSSQREAWFEKSEAAELCVVRPTDELVKVDDFGAMRGFSVGLDNSQSFNAAIAVNNAIKLSIGNYIIHRPIVSTKAGFVIKGATKNSSLITVENSLWDTTVLHGKTFNAAILMSTELDEDWIEGGSFEDFRIVGNSSSILSDGRVGLYFNRVCNGNVASNIEISGCDTGLFTENSWVHTYNNIYINDCYSKSVHLKSAANGYTFNGCELYGRNLRTIYHLYVENACYGVNWNGGAIEFCNVGASIRDNSQVIFSGVDFEDNTTLFIENQNCLAVPSTVDTCTFVGVPSQSLFALNGGNLAFRRNAYIGVGVVPVYSVTTGSVLESEGNDFGGHTVRLTGDTINLSGSDFGAYPSDSDYRSSNTRTLDGYVETSGFLSTISTNDGTPYSGSSSSSKITRVGNVNKGYAEFTLSSTPPATGDFFTFGMSNTDQKVVGTFALSTTGDNLLRTGVYGKVVLDGSGLAYLLKDDGNLLQKSSLSASGDNNLLCVNLDYIDNL